MSDKINALFQLLEGRFGLPPNSIATIALVIVLVLALVLLYSLVKLRSARQVIHQFGERLGYDPPYGDGLEILHEEIGKDILLRGKEVKIEQQAIRVGELEADGERKDADLSMLQRRSKELEGLLQQASIQNERLTEQAGEQAQAHRIAVEQVEQRMRQMETEGSAYLNTVEQRSKEFEDQLQQASLQHGELLAQAGEQERAHQAAVELFEERAREMEAEGIANLTALRQRFNELEDQLQQASHRNNELAAHAGEQGQAHRIAVEQLEQRIREMEAESSDNLSGLLQRSRELEEQLQQESHRNDEFAAQAGEQEHAHRIAVEQLEQRIREMEAGSDANLSAVQQRSRELEEQLQQASLRNDEIAAHAGDQEQAHRIAVEQLEHRIREMEAGSDANLSGLQQRTRELEEQLQQASQRNDELAAYAGEREQAHRIAIDQLEQRIREMEAGSNDNLSGLQQRSRELEEQLRQSSQRNDELTAHAGEQEQAHWIAIDQLEQRIREMEAGSNDNLSGLQQRSRELEEQLQQAATLIENEKSIAHQEALERSADAERLELRIRDLEAETGIEESRATTLELQIKELEEQLRQAADRRALETAETAKTEVAPTEVANGDVSLSTSETFLRRAEWITARAVGEIVPYGLVAAESYASAALAANPQGIDAPQLLAELARIRRAYPEGLPSVIEAVTSFDERAATFFAADLARAADLADDEAQRRYRAGLNRSALLVVNIAIELRRQTAEENSPAMLRLLETKASLLARLGSNARASNGAPELTSQ
jgi:chromosome segregation ATPase